MASIYIDPEENGIGLTLRITKNQGEAIHLVSEGAPGAAVVAVRRVNELDYYSLGFRDLLTKLQKKDPRVGWNKLSYLIRREGLQDDLDYSKTIAIGKSKHIRYSAKALDRLYKIIADGDIEKIWASRKRDASGRATAAGGTASSVT